MVGQTEGHLAVDAHVHVHPCFSPASLFAVASRNLDSGIEAVAPHANGPLRYLLLTETAEADFFDRCRKGSAQLGPWRAGTTSEPEALMLTEGVDTSLVLVAGRQIATEEGLEVLALGTLDRFEDGLTFEETLAAAMTAAIVVIPWGFGKWWGRRGRIVEEAVFGARSWPKPVYLGDNAGRLWWAKTPRLLRRAERSGTPVLPGSDPFPFPGQEARAGRAGFVVKGRVDRGAPLMALREALERRDAVRRFGRGEGTLPFIRSQIRLQIRKRVTI